MSSIGKSLRNIGLAAEAALLLLLAKAAIQIAPLRLLGSYRGAEIDHSDELVDPIVRAVERAARRLPVTFVCYPRALAAHWMLRRRGVRSVLHFGIRPPSADFSAHVWVSVGETIVVGGDEARGFAAVTTYPIASPARSAPYPLNRC